MGSGVSVTIPPEFAGLSEETQQELTTAFLSLKNEGKGDEEALQLIMSKQQQQQQPPIKQILLTELLDTINDIVSRGKTPLIIDDSEDDKVNTFYRYRTVQLIDGKKMGLDKSMKNIPVPTIMEEARVRLVAALKYGTPLVIALTKSVTDFATTFNDVSAMEKFELPSNEGSFFPLEVFHNAGRGLLEEDKLNALFRAEEKEGGFALSRDPAGFHVVITSQFAPEDFEEYLFSNDYGLPKPKELYEFVIIKPE